MWGWAKKVFLTKRNGRCESHCGEGGGQCAFQVPGTKRSLEKLKYKKPREKIAKR